MAERLEIPYYDAALLEEAAKSSGINQKFLESVDEKPMQSHMLYQYMGFTSNEYTAIEKQASQAQREIIEKVASEGSCVIVGRRADLILKDRLNVLKVFITASDQARAKRVSERDQLTEQESVKKIAKVDKERAAYYNQYSEQKWGEASSYDLCIDTDKFGIEGTADLIISTITKIEKAESK